MIQVKVPKLGESVSEAVVARWNKKVGELVEADEPVVALETDKVTFEVPAPERGELVLIAHPEGDTVTMGEVLGEIAPKEGEKRALGEGPPAQPSEGAGSQGNTLPEDVVKGSKPQESPPEPTPRANENEKRVKMTPFRKRAAERLVQAQKSAAVLTTCNEIDLHEVNDLREAYQERFVKKHGQKLGFIGFFLRAAVLALREFPMLNAEIEGDEVIFKYHYDLGVAVAGPRGLVVPVIRGAEGLNVGELERRVHVLADKARAEKLTLEDLSGGTFTVTNGGGFGSLWSTPLLNPPQTGILGMHRIVERPVVKSGQIVSRPMMYVALSYDHRLVDGKDAVLFLVSVKERVEDPQGMLFDL